MAKYTFKYGNGTREFEYPEEDVIKVLEPSVVELPNKSEEEIIRDAIENPIGSPKLEEIVKPGQSVCIVVPDVTRAWARPAIICHVLVEKLEKIGVKDEDIIFLSAVHTDFRKKLISKTLSVRTSVQDSNISITMPITKMNSLLLAHQQEET